MFDLKKLISNWILFCCNWQTFQRVLSVFDFYRKRLVVQLKRVVLIYYIFSLYLKRQMLGCSIFSLGSTPKPICS